MEVLQDHVIYGSWDDTYGHQFLVYYHPNGIDAVVFILGGQDYGGGISFYFNCKTSELDNIINSSNDEYEVYKKVETFGKQKQSENREEK